MTPMTLTASFRSIFSGVFLLCARLRSSNCGAAEGAVDEVVKIVSAIRERWPETRIILRTDSGFSNDALMSWCGEHGVYYLFGTAKNNRLLRRIAPQIDRVRRKYLSQPVREQHRIFRSFTYRTRASWRRSGV